LKNLLRPILVPEPSCGRRSDFNCDGKVDLKDLSIVLARPPVLILRTLSILFTDWTARLPFVSSEGVRATSTPERLVSPSPLAQIQEAFRGTSSTSASSSSSTPSHEGFFTWVVRGLGRIIRTFVTFLSIVF
jgi:hypothetical protein